MADDPGFVDGLIIKAPRPGAPDFVKGSISIKRAELVEWLNARPSEEWINVDIKESRGGKWYAQVNTWKPDANANRGGGDAPQPSGGSSNEAPIPTVEYPEDEDINPEDIPF